MLEVKELYCGYDEVDIIKNVSFKVNNGENLWYVIIYPPSFLQYSICMT